MAISQIEFRFLAEAHKQGCFLRGGNILEFGEANTNRINANKIDVPAAIELVMPPSLERDVMVARARILQEGDGLPNRYEEARLIYKALFDYTSYNAIDLLPPSKDRTQQDLNEPFNLGRQFDVCLNNGTTEHVFNQANCYKAIHDHTRAGGIIVHWTPCLGWVNHGLFHVQPGFFFDLARNNGYTMLLGCFATLTNLFDLDPAGVNDDSFNAHPDLRNALACVVLRKETDAPFHYPLQGKYSSLSEYASSPPR
jgi:hypothetical protein